jgi:hypothetical protein
MTNQTEPVEQDILLLNKKNARIIAIGDDTFVLYTWDPLTRSKNKYVFDDYQLAHKQAAKFMGFEG